MVISNYINCVQDGDEVAFPLHDSSSALLYSTLLYSPFLVFHFVKVTGTYFFGTCSVKASNKLSRY